MKKVCTLFLAFSAIFSLIDAQVNPGGPLGSRSGTAAGWNGQFNGSINGTPSVLTLQQNGTTVEGHINAAGYIYNLNGSSNGANATGRLMDPQTQGAMDFSATLQGDQVTIFLEVPGQAGQNGQLQLSFTRGQGGGSPGTMNQNGQNQNSQNQYSQNQNGKGQMGQGNVERDQRLIGSWRHTESYTSGEFSMVSEWYMQINPDGTYRYGDSKTMGGDAGSSFDSGQGGASTGQWKTSNKIVYINEGYGWQPYANYIIDGYSMMFKFNDGSKQLWERYQ